MNTQETQASFKHKHLLGIEHLDREDLLQILDLAEVFDDINFGVEPPTDTAAWEALLGQALVDHALLSVSLSRYGD